MKKGDYVTKNPDEFTRGLVDAIHEYIGGHGLPDALREETMIEVSHAILSEYEFKVVMDNSRSSFCPSKTAFCTGEALAELLGYIKSKDGEFSMRVEPNPYAIVENKKSEDTIPGGKKTVYPNQKKQSLQPDQEEWRKNRKQKRIVKSDDAENRRLPGVKRKVKSDMTDQAIPGTVRQNGNTGK